MIVYAGSYTRKIAENLGGHGEGIYCLNFDPDEGTLDLRGICAAVSPTYLCVVKGGFLYTHTEVLVRDKPLALAYRIDQDDHSLQLIASENVPGGYPCHVSYSDKYHCVLEACYETGNVVIYPLREDGGLYPPSKILQHEGKSVHALRQDGPHAHAVAVDDDSDTLLVADLGMDKLTVYRADAPGDAYSFRLRQEVAFPPGSGPRHIALHPGGGYAFVLSELTATVAVLRYRGGAATLLQVYATWPEDSTAIPGGAAIRTSPDGRFVYASERTEGYLAIFRFDPQLETLELIDRVSAGGRTPRDFIFDPTGNWLLVANQDSDAIAVFKVDRDTGMLQYHGMKAGIKSPVCFAWC